MKKFPLWSFSSFALAILPLAFFIWFSSSSLDRHVKITIVNDPQGGLAQSIASLTGAYRSLSEGLWASAVQFSEKKGLSQLLSDPDLYDSSLQSLCQEALKSESPSLFILTDKKGGVLYDNLGLPRPTPMATPTATPIPKKKSVIRSSKSDRPMILRASLKDWPGMDNVLSGSVTGGILTREGVSYLVASHPIQGRDETQGIVLWGIKVDQTFFDTLKSTIGTDLAFYSQAQTWSSRPALPAFDLGKLETQAGGPTTLHSEGQDFLAAAIPLMGLDQKTAGTAVLFQPIKQSQLLEGDPVKTWKALGRWILLTVLLLSGLLCWRSISSSNNLTKAMERMREGDFGSFPPEVWPDEWSHLARSLKETSESLKEKGRISLILGKVVSPHAAKKILEANDLFALKGERRECTLLCADLRGFQALSENMPPPALVEALNQYFGLINEIVFKHEGMLDRFMGETAVAVWGVPFPHEDKEARAVKAALEIQEALKEFNISRIKKGTPPFALAIGIHTGTVVSGNLGSERHHDYTVIGEPLHVASRLCAMAVPGQIVASEETYEKIKALVNSDPLNPIAVKNRMEPLKTFEITELL